MSVPGARRRPPARRGHPALRDFHPAVAGWFADTLGRPTPPQERGWPAIRRGEHVLIAAPTGSGKTLAAFLTALDGLLRQGQELPDATRVLYVSPLRALGHDVRRNLEAPLSEIRARDGSLPEVRTLVRTGDTPARDRAAMGRRPPHVLVTTPESLYILLGSEGGRSLVRHVRTVIADEVHAVLGDKRAPHLALSLERLEDLCGPLQRIGLSATQRPVEEVGRFLAGAGRSCTVIDEGHRREIDLAIELPGIALEPVCSDEVWREAWDLIARRVEEHATTLVFVKTRKEAERVAARLATRLGAERVTCHHGSLSRERRLDAEERLKAGRLRALVATASLELGIDVGDVELVVQIGSVHSIATLLQRVGRSGHALGRVPKGRIVPLTADELVEAIALVRCVRRGRLDRTPPPGAPLDILGQQLVAECANGARPEDELRALCRRALPYRTLDEASFRSVVGLYTGGRGALLHRDGVRRRLRGTRRARLTSLTSGGAIPDRADYAVVVEPEGSVVGTVDEDFAVESSIGDIFQLGASSWQVLKVESGTLRVADAGTAPPTLPFWFGEAPARTRELSAEVAAVRRRAAEGTLSPEAGIGPEAVRQVTERAREGERMLGAAPGSGRVVIERFFDESGGMQLVIHASLGGRILRAWGLALRKRFCRRFGFELQAAANEDAVLISLGPHHSFPLDEVLEYLRPESVRDTLVQALLATPMFETRWRWNVARALLVERRRGGRRVPAPLLRMRADDLLAAAFPDAVACGENLPAGDLPVPLDHPLVRQTVDDCLNEALDVEGLTGVLEDLRDGKLATRCVDVAEPSPWARGILAARPYSFLDDAPIEERRTQAVRRGRGPRTGAADDDATPGALSPGAVRRVREEAWPRPEGPEEVHEALLWMGWVEESEARSWRAWLEELRAAGRAVQENGRWYAVEIDRTDRPALWRGRLEALGVVAADDPALFALEGEGTAVRVEDGGRTLWWDRRLLQRARRYSAGGRREAVRPVSAAEFLRFLGRWQHAAPGTRLEGPAGVREVVHQLAGLEATAPAWEREILPARVEGYDPAWLDDLVLRGDLAWGRLWGSATPPARSTPICIVPREDLDAWLGLAPSPGAEGLGAGARAVLDVLRRRGASFAADVAREAGLLPSFLEAALAELVGRGLVTADALDPLRRLLAPGTRRRRRHRAPPPAGRLGLLRDGPREAPGPGFVADRLLARWGVVFPRLLVRERLPVPWRDVSRELRQRELRGTVRGGRFVVGFSGEQFALPEAASALRRMPREPADVPLEVSAADPLNLAGILTPGERVPASARRRVSLG